VGRIPKLDANDLLKVHEDITEVSSRLNTMTDDHLMDTK
jgi:hypothetical protein